MSWYIRNQKIDVLLLCPYRAYWIINCLLYTNIYRDRFPVVSLDFSVTYSFRPFHGLGGRLSPLWKWVPGISPGGKGGRCVRLATSPPSCAKMSWKSGSVNLLEPSGPHRACYGTTLYLCINIYRNKNRKFILNYSDMFRCLSQTSHSPSKHKDKHGFIISQCKHTEL